MPTRSRASCERRGSRLRSRGCGSRCACSSRRSRHHAAASSRRLTRSGESSSATCTTARSSGCSRSGSRYATLRRQLGEDSAAARGTLDQAVDEVTTAVAELREIARGLRPGVLDGAGLAGALSEVAGRCPVPVALEITSKQLSPQMEATVFFLACEAVTNAIKHAGARHIRIRVDRHGEQLRLEVADDGVGGARLCASGGLAGMTQRALAGGGSAARRQSCRRRDPHRRRAARGPVVRVVVAEDSALVREGLVRLLRDNGEDVVAAVADGRALVDAAVEHQPDLVIIDVRMPPTYTDEGARAARLRAEIPGLGGAGPVPGHRAFAARDQPRRRRFRLPAQGPRAGHQRVLDRRAPRRTRRPGT